MPDITMCSGGDCPQRARCFRFMARPNVPLQSYFDAPPFDSYTQECEHYYNSLAAVRAARGSEERQVGLTDYDHLTATLSAIGCDYDELVSPFGDLVMPLRIRKRCRCAVVVGGVFFGFGKRGRYLGRTEDDGVWSGCGT